MLRQATPEDLSDIIRLAKQASLFNYGRTIYSLLVTKKLMFVMEQNGLVTGYVTAFPLTSTTAFCLQVAVCQNSRDKGIGSNLMAYIEDYMRGLGITTLFAHTTKERSFTYFIKKLNYVLWWRCGWLRIIQKNLLQKNPGCLPEQDFSSSAGP